MTWSILSAARRGLRQATLVADVPLVSLDNGDGCSSTCTLEPGYTCDVPGTPCTLIDPYCPSLIEPDNGQLRYGLECLAAAGGYRYWTCSSCTNLLSCASLSLCLSIFLPAHNSPVRSAYNRTVYSLAHYTCNAGYSLFGFAQRACQSTAVGHTRARWVAMRALHLTSVRPSRPGRVPFIPSVRARVRSTARLASFRKCLPPWIILCFG